MMLTLRNLICWISWARITETEAPKLSPCIIVDPKVWAPCPRFRRSAPEQQIPNHKTPKTLKP